MNPALIATATLNHIVPDITYWINKAKINAAGKVPVSMRVTLQGKRTEISTGIRCLPEEWNKATNRLQSVVWSEKKQAYVALREPSDAVVHLNTLLDSLEAKTRLLAADMRQTQGATKPLLVKQLRRKLLGEADPEVVIDILPSLDQLLGGYPNPSTRTAFTRAIKCLRQFLAPKVTMSYEDATPALAVQFKAWAIKNIGEVGAVHSVAVLSSLFNKLRLPITNPFVGLSNGRSRRKKPRYVLSFEELEQMAQLSLPEGSDEAVARDIYLTQYYLHGSRVGVILELPWQQVDMLRGRVQFKAEKGGDWRNVEMQPELIEILERYQGVESPLVFPVLPADYLEP